MSDCSTPGGCGPSTTVCGTGGWNGPKPGDPDNNSILRAEPGYGGIQLYWTMPNINDHAVAHTRVFRSIGDQFDTAIPLVVVAGNNYFDTGAGDPIRQYFYWIQHVSINGTVLDPIGPAWATARPYLEQILQDLAEQIEDGMLARSLRSRIDKIADLEAGLTILNNLVITENEVVGRELVGLRNDVTNAMVYIDQQNTLRITEQAALVSSVNTLVAQMSDNLSAAIQQEMLVIAEDIGDLQGQYTLKIDLGGYVSGFGLSSRVDPTGAKTSEFGVLASSFFIGPPSVVSSTAPSNPFHGKVWVDTSGGGSVTKWYNRFSLQWQTTPVKGAVPFIVKTSPEVMPDGYTIEPGVYMDSAFIGRLNANQIDTRGLTIRDAAGNLILGAGTGLDWNLVQGVNKPQDGATRVVFRGDWTTSTVYQVGDTVLFNGSGWAAREQHTSSGSNQPPSSGNQNTWWNAFAVKGNDGESALTTIVPNESHTLPALFDGVVSSYAGSGTTIQVFEGATALNAVSTLSANGQFTIGVPTQSPVSTLTVGGLTFSGTTATVAQHAGMVSGTDTVIITYPITARTSTGNVISYSVTQTLTKSKAGATGATGAAGANARAAFLSATSQVFQVSKTGVTTPASITLTASGQNVAGNPTFTVIAGTATLTGTGNTRAIAPASMTTDSATVQITWDGQADTITIVRVREGIDGAAGAAGANGTNGLSVATAYIYQRSATAPALPTTNVTFTFSGGAITGLNNGWTAAVPAGTDPLYVATGVASGLASTATIAPASWSTPTILAQNGTAGATGAAGAAGLNSATVYLFQRTATAAPPALPSVSTTYTFSSGVATGQNNGWVTSMPTTGGAFRWMTTASASSAGASDTIANTEWSAAALLAEDGAAGANGAPGTDGLTVVFSNESHTVPASNAGVVSSYVGSGTTVQVFEGTTPLSAVATIAANSQFTVGAPTLAPAASMVVGAISHAGTTATVAQHSGMPDATDVSTITFPISVRRANGTTVNLSRTQTITKSRTGAAGAAGPQGSQGVQGPQGVAGAVGASGLNFSEAKTLFTDPTFQNGINGFVIYNNAGNGTVTHTREARQSDSPFVDSGFNVRITTSGVASPGLGGFIQLIQTRPSAVFVQRIVAKIPVGYRIEQATNALGDLATNTWLTSTAGTGRFEEYILVRRCGATGSFHVSGHIFIHGGPAGTPAAPVTWHVAYASVYDFTAIGFGNVTAILSNESHTVPTDSAGNNPNLAGASTVMSVFNGSSDDSHNWSFSATPVNVTGSLSGATYTVSGISADAGHVDITASRGGYSNVTRRFTVARSRAGTAGATGASAKAAFLLASSQVFQIAKSGAAAPADITLTATGQNVTGSPSFSVTSGTATLTGTGNTRTLTFANMATDAVTVQMTWDGQTDTITLVKVREGLDGASGLNVATAYIYRRSATAPALPSANATYTFSSGALAGLNNSWTASVPAGTDPLYVSTAVASSASASATIAPASWASPVVLAQNGATGATGATGAAGAAGANGLNFSEAQSLFTDTTFQRGNNGLVVYNNAGNGTVTHTREPRQPDSPYTNSEFNIRVSTNGPASPGFGGIVHGIMTRANAVFVQRIVAKVPVGYVLNHHTNSMGTGGFSRWLTSNVGTGTFQEYLLLRQSGSSGVFGDTGYIAIEGPSQPVTWWIAFAGVYDFTAPGIAPTVTVTGNRALTFTSTDGVLDASQENIVLTATTSGIGSPAFVWTFNGFAVAPTNSGASTQTITAANIGAARSATVTCTVNGAFVDQVTITRLDRSTAAAGATVGANESNLQMGVGGNLLRNSDLLMSDAHWVGGWASAPGGTTIAQRNIAGLNWSPFGGNTFGINRASFTPTGVWDFGNTARIPVIPGTRYEASAFLASHRCNCNVFLLFHNSSGAQVGEFHSAQVSAHGGQSLSNWSRALVFAVAPPTAAWVTFHVRSHATGENDPYTWVFQPFVGVAGAMQTVASRWTPGNFAEQITPANASTYIANAAIGTAQIQDASITAAKIGSLALVGTNNFSVRTATAGARMEMDSRAIKIFDANGVLRVQLGDLTA